MKPTEKKKNVTNKAFKGSTFNHKVANKAHRPNKLIKHGGAFGQSKISEDASNQISPQKLNQTEENCHYLNSSAYRVAPDNFELRM